MLEALLAALSCTLLTNLVEYKNGAYHGVKVIECPAKIVQVDLPYIVDNKADNVKLASLSISLNSDKKSVTITNEIEVERPWIAPQPIFMEVAKTKHDDKLAEELAKILGK